MAVSSGSFYNFRLVARERLIGTGLRSSTRTITCGTDTKDTESYNFAVVDSFGTAHPLPSTIKVDNDHCAATVMFRARVRPTEAAGNLRTTVSTACRLPASPPALALAHRPRRRRRSTTPTTRRAIAGRKPSPPPVRDVPDRNRSIISIARTASLRPAALSMTLRAT